jgi:hypothetical protein
VAESTTTRLALPRWTAATDTPNRTEFDSGFQNLEERAAGFLLWDSTDDGAGNPTIARPTAAAAYEAFFAWDRASGQMTICMDTTGAGGWTWVEVGPEYQPKIESSIIPAGAFAAVNGSPSLSGVAFRWPAWFFDATAEEHIAAPARFPADWVTVDVDIQWTNVGTGTGDVVWEVFIDTAAVAGSLATSGTSGRVTATAPSQNVRARSIAITGLTINHADLKNIRVLRRAGDAADSLANDAAVLAISLRKAS